MQEIELECPKCGHRMRRKRSPGPGEKLERPKGAPRSWEPFAQFWALYPNRRGDAFGAFHEWQQFKPDPEEVDKMRAQLERDKASDAWRNHRRIPGITFWLWQWRQQPEGRTNE